MEKQVKKEESHPFDYTNVPLPEDCVFKISPSSISKFFEFPIIWYKDQVLKEKQFEGSTGSVLGSVIHGLAERFAKGLPSDRALVDAYLRKYMMNDDVNTNEVRELYPDMAAALINQYIAKNKPTTVEESLCFEFKDGIYIAGTCDNRTGDMVVDYKNVSTKPASEKIPWGYYIQLMAYAYMFKRQGIDIRRIRIVYTVRPTKTLPVRVFVLTEEIGETDFKAIEDVLTLIADTVLLSIRQPELKYLLFKSMQLKEQ